MNMAPDRIPLLAVSMEKVYMQSKFSVIQRDLETIPLCVPSTCTSLRIESNILSHFLQVWVLLACGHGVYIRTWCVHTCELLSASCDGKSASQDVKSASQDVKCAS